jgi:mannose-6-phosphate isomerase
MFVLENSVRNYAWGSRIALAALRGLTTPSAAPEAEMD